MKDQGEDNHGSRKKFLYTGPKTKEPHPNEYWDTFAPKKKANSGFDFDMDEVWSIKKNVTIGTPAGGSLAKPTGYGGNSYYSRHSNVKFGAEDSNTIAGTSSALSGGNTPWTHSSRSNYSYTESASGSALRQTTDDRDNMTSTPPTARTVPNKQNSGMMQAGGVPGSYGRGGRTQKNNRSTGSSWMDF
ncbi:uncharacterized protein [Ptychodera flava]|uniref:uncharacterized protein isoform X2 n=1 Tax=Ptychodera flava TaxID=63121 RepID=UPI003969FF21